MPSPLATLLASFPGLASFAFAPAGVELERSEVKEVDVLHLMQLNKADALEAVGLASSKRKPYRLRHENPLSDYATGHRTLSTTARRRWRCMAAHTATGRLAARPRSLICSP